MRLLLCLNDSNTSQIYISTHITRVKIVARSVLSMVFSALILCLSLLICAIYTPHVAVPALHQHCDTISLACLSLERP